MNHNTAVLLLTVLLFVAYSTPALVVYLYERRTPKTPTKQAPPPDATQPHADDSLEIDIDALLRYLSALPTSQRKEVLDVLIEETTHELDHEQVPTFKRVLRTFRHELPVISSVRP